MTTEHDRLELAGTLVRALASARQSAGLYPLGHPERLGHGEQLAVAAGQLLDATPASHPTLFVDRGSFYLGTLLLPRESLAFGRLAEELTAAGIESLTIAGEVAAGDVDRLVEIVVGATALRSELGGLRLNAVRPATRGEEPWEERLRELRQAYAGGVSVLREAARQALAEEPVDLAAATAVVDRLYDEVEHDPGYGLLLSAVKSYDEYTYFHMVNVCLLSVALGQAIGLRRDQVLVLGLGGLLHDIGKVFVPAEILRGTGRLDEEQWRLVQRHPVDGAAMLLATGTGLYHPATSILLEHHAAYDRSGYPALHEHHPSAPSRLVAVADCFDAVTSKRSYREALDRHRALELLASAAGHGLDPDAVAAFRALLGTFPVGSLVRLSSGEVGVVVRQDEAYLDRPTVLVLFDATDTPTEVAERELASEAPAGPTVVSRVDPDHYGVDLARFVVSGRLQEPEDVEPGGLVHEPSPGEPVPEGYVDTHHHDHAVPEGHQDPDVAPPIGP